MSIDRNPANNYGFPLDYAVRERDGIYLIYRTKSCPDMDRHDVNVWIVPPKKGSPSKKFLLNGLGWPRIEYVDTLEEAFKFVLAKMVLG